MPLDWDVPSDRDLTAVATWLRAAEDAEGRELGDPFEVEERKAHDYQALETEAREFVKRYGGAAMLRCVSEALK